ncbi:MAG: class I SAM-dependent methyltransferase [Armatimonadetes bacterium]|nr:class I SAM-dependent methyltransferase [Armatimonadota bacterium]
MSEMHEANRAGWDAVSPHWQARVEARGTWRRCHREPALVLAPAEIAYLRDVTGRDACVLGSGDNLVVFALAGMGARVTSVDISQAQLDTAARRARDLGLEIRFLRADVTDLAALPDANFDLVYTGGHVAVWVSGLRRSYAEAGRILRPGGLFLVNEYHPFRRVWHTNWEREPKHLALEFGYFDRGPHRYDRSEEVPGATPGTYPSFEYHWTVADFVAAMLASGCELLALDEFGAGREGWDAAPLEGLPLCLLLVGRKRRAPEPCYNGRGDTDDDDR